MTERVASDEAVRAKIQEVLARPDYVLNPAEPNNDVLLWWMWLLELVLTPIRWLFQLTEGLPEFLRWLIVVGLSLLLVVLIGHIIYSLFSALKRTSQNDEEFAASLVQAGPDPEALERRAADAEKRGEWIEAVRLLMRASVARFELREKRNFRRGTTNREHLRRYRGTVVHEPLEVLVRAIEWKWYGEEPCERTDYENCRQAYARVVRMIDGGQHAHRA